MDTIDELWMNIYVILASKKLGRTIGSSSIWIAVLYVVEMNSWSVATPTT